MNRAFLKFLPVLMAAQFSAIAQQTKSTGLPELKWNYTSFAEQKTSEREAWLLYNQGQAQHPEIGKLYTYAPNASCIEEIGKRTEFEKHYINKNDPAAFSIQKSYMPLHYRKNGEWLTIDSRLQAKAPGIYEAANQQEPVGFDISKRESYIVTPGGKVAFNHWKLYGKNSDGTITELPAANWSKVTAGDDGIRITDIFAGIDAEMHVVRGAIKTNFIVKQNKYKAFTQLIFKDQFATGKTNTLQYKRDANGPVLLAAAGQNLLQIEKAFAYPEKQSGAHIELAYALQGDLLGMAVDVAYIEKYIGSGHVIIDPLVSGSATLTASSISSMYNASCNWDAACTYSISVATPAGATFTDVLWTMGIVATSPCGRENGGFRISSGSCVSPGTSFWTCSDGAGGTATGPGSCAGVNVSGWSTFSSCLPAPACTSSNITFNVMLYRGCVGPTGCDNTCIGTATPFTMTIEGRTVEYANGIVRSTAKDSVCSGTSVILSKVTQNGIPPYSATNWSSSRTGSPSLGTGDSLTISRPAGTYWFYARTTDACSNLAIDSQKIYVDSVLKPTVSTPVIYCQGQTASALTATASGASYTLYWYSLPSGGGGSTSAPVPSTSTVGSNNYYVSQRSYLGCEGDRSTLAVQVNRTPAAPPAPSPVVYCQDATPVALTATKPDPTDTLLWYTVSSGGTGSKTAITPSTASVGSVIYYVSAKSSLNCEGPRTPITVQVTRVPAAPAATSPVVYCQNAGSIALTATKPDPTDTLLWYTTATGGTGSKTAITPATTTAGSVLYYVSAKSSGNCEGPRTPITVQINRTPAAPSVTGMASFCQNTTPVELTATKPDATDTLYWYTVSSGGTGSTTAIAPPTGTVGSTTYYVSAKSADGCEGPRSSIAVGINPAPGTPTVSTPLSYCLGATASVLTATKAAASDTLYWYTAATGGSGSTTAPAPATTAAGMINYYVGERNFYSCDGPRTAIAVFTSPAIPSFEIKTPDSILCLGESTSLSTRTGTTDSLTSTIVNNNNQNGVMFDINAKRAITINSFEVNTDNATDAPVAIYYKAGTHVSFETSSASWTLLGLANITGTENSYTKIPLPLNVTIPAGQTAAFYITHTNGTLINYSNGTGVGNIITQDTNIQILEGVAKAYPFSTTYSPRRFEGKIHYSTVNVTWSTGSTLDTITVAPTVTTKYWARIANTLGCKNTDTIQVQVNPIPTAPVVVTPVIYCQNETPAALSATKSSATDTLYWYNASSGGTGSTTAPVLSTSTVGSTIYYVSQRTVWGCEGNRSALTVQVNRTPAAPAVPSATVVYCQNATASALSATKPDATDTLFWYTTASGGTGSRTAITPVTTTTGTFTFYVSAKSSLNCEGPRTAVTVTVNPTPTAPVVVTPVVYCQGEASAPLSATKLLASDTVLWYTVATGGTASKLTITPSTATPGSATHYVSLKNTFGCEGPRSSISVTINPTPGAPSATTPVIYCQGATASALSAVLASPADSLLWYTVASGGTGSKTAPTPSTSATGTTTYYVSGKTTLNCEGPRTAVSVTVNPTPLAPSATTTVSYCQNASSVPLTATKASTTDTLYWYTTASGGTGSTVAPIPVTTTPGTFNFYVSAKNTSKCEGPRTNIVVTINATPAAPTVSSPVNLCIGGSTAALTATGSGLLWYTSSAGGTGSATAPTPSTSIVSTITHYVSQTVSGCEGPRSSITVTVNDLPAAPTVVTPVIYCQNSTATALTAPKGSTDTLIWYTVASGGTGSKTAPVPSTTATGSTTSYVSVRSQYKCEGNRSAIVVTVNPTPAAPSVTTPVVYCKDATAVALVATKSTSTDTLKWYIAASGGTGSLTAPVPSTTAAGTFFGYVSQTNTFKCESPRATITITINPLPATPGITTPLNLCIGGPSSALTATGTAIKWYTAATGGTGSSTAPTPSTATTGTTTYYVTQTESVNSCESPRAAFNVIVNALPAAPGVATPLNLCIGSTAVPLTAVGTSLKWYTAATGGTGSGTAPTPSTAALGSTMYYVTQTSSVGCESPRAPLEVAVQSLPVVTITPVGIPGFFYCDGKRVTMKANSATATSYQWYSGSTLITGATKDTLSTGTTGNYKVQVANVYGCKAEATVFVQKDTTAFPILTPAEVFICEESSTLLNVHPAYTSFIFDWYKDGLPAIPASPKSNIRSVNLPGTYKVTVTNLFGCINTTNDAVVSYYPRPVKPTIVRMDPVLGLSPSSYRYYQWYRNGSKIFAATNPTYTYTMDGDYHVQITDSNGCLNYSDTINVNGLSITPNKAKTANIRVYPNPTSNALTIEAPVTVNVQVLDMVGKIILEQKDAKSIRLEHFADGTYMLRIFDANNQLIGVERISKVSN